MLTLNMNSAKKKGRFLAEAPLDHLAEATGSGFVAEAFLLAGAAFQQLLGGLISRLTLVVELAADHVLALGLTLGFVGRTDRKSVV